MNQKSLERGVIIKWDEADKPICPHCGFCMREKIFMKGRIVPPGCNEANPVEMDLGDIINALVDALEKRDEIITKLEAKINGRAEENT